MYNYIHTYIYIYILDIYMFIFIYTNYILGRIFSYLWCLPSLYGLAPCALRGMLWVETIYTFAWKRIVKHFFLQL